jgi:hypothetical protein
MAEDKDIVQIVPATTEQKIQYSKHLNGEMFSDLPSYDFPGFSQAQLKQVPDIIDGVPITEHEKKLILLDSHEYSASSNWSSTFSIDNNNNLISKYHDVDANMEPFEIQKFILKRDVLFVIEEVKPKEILFDKPQLDLLIERFANTEQKEKLMEGKGAVININDSKFYVYPGPEKQNPVDLNTFRILPEERAKILKMIPEEVGEKNNKLKGIKL